MTPVLFRTYPDLAQRLHWLALVERPTPVQRLAALERRTRAGSIWVKRDDLTARPYGGNKPRKLEFLLGAARARGARALITFGGLGSNHALATALYGRQHGFGVRVVLVPQPVDDHVRATVAAIAAQRASVQYASSDAGAVLAGLRCWLSTAAGDLRRPYLIPPGGSTPLGALGYVDAALELAEQVAAGELPAPDAIFVASGSNGTAAGLLVGLRLAGLPSRLIAVRVSDRLRTDAVAVSRLATATSRLLAQSCPAVPRLTFTPTDLELWSDYLGDGYGHPTQVGDQAVALLAETEDLGLERTYTGKAMAALLDAVNGPGGEGRNLLFWHTYNSQPVEHLWSDGVDVARLPRPVRECLAGAARRP